MRPHDEPHAAPGDPSRSSSSTGSSTRPPATVTCRRRDRGLPPESAGPLDPGRGSLHRHRRRSDGPGRVRRPSAPDREDDDDRGQVVGPRGSARATSIGARSSRARPTGRPHPRDWPPSDARSLILEQCGDAPLVELVTIRQLRRKRILQRDGTSVELSLDEVDAVSRSRVVGRFVELEVELMSGDEAGLAEIDRELAEDPGLAPAGTSKLQSALRAVAAAEPKRGRRGASILAPVDEDATEPARNRRADRPDRRGRPGRTRTTTTEADKPDDARAGDGGRTAETTGPGASAATPGSADSPRPRRPRPRPARARAPRHVRRRTSPFGRGPPPARSRSGPRLERSGGRRPGQRPSPRPTQKRRRKTSAPTSSSARRPASSPTTTSPRPGARSSASTSRR